MIHSMKLIADLSDIPRNTNKAFNIEGMSILICHTERGLFAVKNQCTHQKYKLEGGRMKSCYLFCPKHSVRFDLRTGKPAGTLVQEPVKTFELSIIDNEIFINIPI